MAQPHRKWKHVQTHPRLSAILTPSIFGIDDMFMATAGPLVGGLLPIRLCGQGGGREPRRRERRHRQRRQYEQNRTDRALS